MLLHVFYIATCLYIYIYIVYLLEDVLGSDPFTSSCVAPASRAAWPGRWPPTPWTWSGPAWWTSGFRRAPPCTKERWTDWCRRGRTRASSPSIRASGPTGCGWGPGTSSYPSERINTKHSVLVLFVGLFLSPTLSKTDVLYAVLICINGAV